MGAQAGLLTLIATESVSVRAEEKLTAFVKLERRLIPKGEQFLLQMRTADDGRRFIVHSDPVSASTWTTC
jgi:hypothetical protein